MSAKREPLVTTLNSRPPLPQGDKRAARRIARYDLQREAAELLPRFRVAGCCWRPVSSAVDVIKHPETKSTHYGRGVMHCGSVWTCPVCAAKVTEKRRLEIKAAVDTWHARGFSVFMVTFTLQHNAAELLITILAALIKAIRQFKSGAPWQRREARYKLAGNIKSVEFTISHENGWHPHLHILFYSELAEWQLDPEAIKQDFSDRYCSILADDGRYASAIYGVDVKIGNQAIGEYLAKAGQDVAAKVDKHAAEALGLDWEMTKQGQKQGQADGHYTPFQLLELAKAGDDWAKAKYKEYAENTKGLQQLRWSPGLRDLLGLGQEITDEEITDGLLDTGGVTFFTFTNPEWKHARYAGGKDRRGIMLEAGREMDSDQFAHYIRLLLATYQPTHYNEDTNPETRAYLEAPPE